MTAPDDGTGKGVRAFRRAILAGASFMAVGACVPAVVNDTPGDYTVCDTSPTCGDNVAIEVK